MNYLKKILLISFSIAILSNVNADDNYDLDDIREWDIVSVETCLDAVLDTIPGHPRKLEMKMEGDDPVYEFDIDAKDGNTYNVECNAEEGFVTEIEREASANDPVFKKYAKVSLKDAQATALMFHPGKIVSTEYEVGSDGTVTYEFDIQTKLGYEIKVDVDATTGEIEEANIELYEIGTEDE
jgi:uncharacterized membrane protein YkoI